MKRIILPILFAVALLLTGCSMGIEVNDRAFVQLMGIERENEIYYVSMQVYKSESGAPEPDVSKANTITANGEGTTIHEAISAAELTLGKNAFLGHIKMLVVGNGVKNPADELSLFLDGSVSPSCPVAYSDNPAAVIETLPEEGSFSAEQILALADSSAAQGKTVFTSVAELAASTGELDTAAALPIIAAEEKSVRFEGITLAQKNGVQGNLDEKETLGAKLLLNQFETGDKITVPVEVDGNRATVFITKACTKLDAKMSDGLTVNAEIKLKMTVAENPYGIKPALVEKAARQQISESCRLAYSAAVHENLCDIFGIKKLVRRYCPERYNDYCNAERSYLAGSTLNLKVKSEM
ncbi:MAG: hypothetical protein IJ035_07710 [Oscillospiraceae bacterium]|nr:hypothetical protein [Oscillospiraceae bacterium]